LSGDDERFRARAKNERWNRQRGELFDCFAASCHRRLYSAGRLEVFVLLFTAENAESAEEARRKMVAVTDDSPFGRFHL
jgi:hypothetical protein